MRVRTSCFPRGYLHSARAQHVLLSGCRCASVTLFHQVRLYITDTMYSDRTLTIYCNRWSKKIKTCPKTAHWRQTQTFPLFTWFGSHATDSSTPADFLLWLFPTDYCLIHLMCVCFHPVDG